MNIQNHRDVVEQVAAEGAPGHTLPEALQFVLRVVARLNQLFPEERAGLMEKTAGESITPYNGTMVSAGRVCYPDNHVFKVLTDVPTTDGPEWVDDGFVDGIGYNKGYLAVAAPQPAVVTQPEEPVDQAPATEISAVLKARLDEVDAQFAALNNKVDQLATKADIASLRQQVVDAAKSLGGAIPFLSGLFGKK
jgi:hypothetical protein